MFALYVFKIIKICLNINCFVIQKLFCGFNNGCFNLFGIWSIELFDPIQGIFFQKFVFLLIRQISLVEFTSFDVWTKQYIIRNFFFNLISIYANILVCIQKIILLFFILILKYHNTLSLIKSPFLSIYETIVSKRGIVRLNEPCGWNAVNEMSWPHKIFLSIIHTYMVCNLLIKEPIFSVISRVFLNDLVWILYMW